MPNNQSPMFFFDVHVVGDIYLAVHKPWFPTADKIVGFDILGEPFDRQWGVDGEIMCIPDYRYQPIPRLEQYIEMRREAAPHTYKRKLLYYLARTLGCSHQMSKPVPNVKGLNVHIAY